MTELQKKVQYKLSSSRLGRLQKTLQYNCQPVGKVAVNTVADDTSV